jgi:3-hydroxybutyryl-CoA dehydrogenase
MHIETVGIVGAGTMGNGIAQTAAVAGLKVVMIDVTDAALSKGLAALSSSLERLVSKGKLDVDARAAALARIETSTDYQRLRDANIVIEAATENNDLKVRILKQIESVARPDAIIASNTSSISITALGAALADPSRFIGMHFFKSGADDAACRDHPRRAHEPGDGRRDPRVNDALRQVAHRREEFAGIRGQPHPRADDQ